MKQPGSRTCVVLQPGYLPWLGFFEQMHRADVFVYLDDAQFDKNGWRNRNRIKGPAGPQWLTVPVRVAGRPKPRIDEVRIDASNANWARKHLTTLRMNYGPCPFFDWLHPELESVFARSWTHLAALDIALVDALCAKLGLHRDIRRTSAMALPPGRCERLIDLCRQLDCDAYYTGNASRAYLDVDAFAQAGIHVTFQEYEHPCYAQRYAGFVPYLSVVDLMFNHGPASLDIVTGAPTGAGRASGWPTARARDDPTWQTTQDRAG